MDDFVKGIKVGKLISKDKKDNNLAKLIGAIAIGIAVVAAIAAAGYFIYNKFSKDDYDEFEDYCDDLFDEDEVDDIFEE